MNNFPNLKIVHWDLTVGHYLEIRLIRAIRHLLSTFHMKCYANYVTLTLKSR